MQDRFVFHISLSGSRAKSLSDIMKAITLMNRDIKLLKDTRDVYLISNSGGYQFAKHMLVHVTKKPNARELTDEVALLNRISDNPLVPIDCKIATIIDSTTQTTMSYVSDWICQDPPVCVTIKAKHPLAAIPFIMQSSRMGISLGMSCCQTLVALSMMTKEDYEEHDLLRITAEDLLTAVAGVMYNIAKLSVTKSDERFLTSSFWNAYLNSHTTDEIVCAIHSITKIRASNITKALAILKDGFTDIYKLVFGRIEKKIDRVFTPEKGAQYAIVILTEQMGIFDLGRLLVNDSSVKSIRVLYTPLTLTTMRFMSSVCSIVKPKKRLKFYYHTGFLPITTETLLRYHVEKSKRKPTIIIPGGGQLNFLISLKIRKDYNEVILGW